MEINQPNISIRNADKNIIRSVEFLFEHIDNAY